MAWTAAVVAKVAVPAEGQKPDQQKPEDGDQARLTELRLIADEVGVTDDLSPVPQGHGQVGSGVSRCASGGRRARGRRHHAALTPERR